MTTGKIFTVLLFLFLFNFGGSPAGAEENCSENTVCVITAEGDNGVSFNLKNRQTYEITITLGFDTLENMAASVKMPYTVTIPGGKTIPAFRIYPVNPENAWTYYYNWSWRIGNNQARHDNSYVYGLPYAPGRPYLVIQDYTGSYSHFDDNLNAIDWEMPEGTPVAAARPGTVLGTESRYNEGGPDKKYLNTANYIIIKHDDGTYGEYVHLKPGGVKVRIGQKVKKGEIIGYSGNTGYSTHPHLHFIVYKAADGKRRQTYKVRFQTRERGESFLREGEAYSAVIQSEPAGKSD